MGANLLFELFPVLYKHLFSADREQVTKQREIPPKSSVVNQWDYCVFLQIVGKGLFIEVWVTLKQLHHCNVPTHDGYWHHRSCIILWNFHLTFCLVCTLISLMIICICAKQKVLTGQGLWHVIVFSFTKECHYLHYNHDRPCYKSIALLISAHGWLANVLTSSTCPTSLYSIVIPILILCKFKDSQTAKIYKYVKGMIREEGTSQHER